MNVTNVNNYISSLNSYIKQTTTYINNNFNIVNSSISRLQNNELVEIIDLTNKVNAQNKQIDQQITINYNKQNKIQDIKTRYEEIEVNNIKSQNTTLLIIYYIIVIILSIALIILKPGNMYLVYGIISFCLVYPFIITYIEYFFYYLFITIYNFFTNNPVTGNIYITSNF